MSELQEMMDVYHQIKDKQRHKPGKTCRIKEGTYAAQVAEVLSTTEWMDHQDVKNTLKWGPDDSASSVLSDMITRTCPHCIERRLKPTHRLGNAVYEYRLQYRPKIES